jgi:hypothetical protein
MTTEPFMSNGALPLALGATGGFLLWYFLRDGKHDAHASAVPAANTKNPSPATAASVSAAAASPTAQAAPAASAEPPVQIACTLRLDASGLTVDGARVGIAEAVNRCKLAGLADVTASKEVPAAAYAELMLALGRAGIPAFANRNGSGRRNSRRTWPRTVADVDLPSFALMVQALADDIEPDPNPDGRARGRFGNRKVFIAAIRRALHATKYADLPRAAIDELLFRAHREQLLVLARADLVAAMDSDEVRDSELVTDGAQFHFVVVEPDAARNANTYRTFTLVIYTEARKAGPRRRWFLADPPTTWADARDRLGAAGILDPTLAGRTATPSGWMLSVDPASFREELAEPLPAGGSNGE